jgi:hypothetical protein
LMQIGVRRIGVTPNLREEGASQLGATGLQ